jgi:hypothetical protein
MRALAGAAGGRPSHLDIGQRQAQPKLGAHLLSVGGHDAKGDWARDEGAGLDPQQELCAHTTAQRIQHMPRVHIRAQRHHARAAGEDFQSGVGRKE